MAELSMCPYCYSHLRARLKALQPINFLACGGRGWPEQFAETAAWQENVRRAHFSVPQELEHI